MYKNKLAFDIAQQLRVRVRLSRTQEEDDESPKRCELESLVLFF